MSDQYSTEIPILLQSHLDHLLKSGISLDVIRERGYKTVYGSGPELQSLGFSKAQMRRPAGILIPLHGVDGKIVGYQYRPDNPRIQTRTDGTSRKVKYENPPDQANRIDIPIRCREAAGNPNVDCYITEGTKKVDALVTAGAGFVIGLSGVWNFRGKNKYGGKTLIADFQDIAFNGRKVYIVFDSDSSTNPNVARARDQLAEILSIKGALVEIVNLPGDKDQKVGVDDYLVLGHTLQEVNDLKGEKKDKTALGSPYLLNHGILSYGKSNEYGGIESAIPLGNFSARITDVIEKDDGLEVVKYFRIIGRSINDEMLPEVEVPCKEFESLNWIVENWDVRAYISADRSAKARMKEALLYFSSDAKRKYIYRHTGWRDAQGKRLFLNAGGAIGSPETNVELDDDLVDYVLPQPVADPRESLLASYRFLYIGKLEVMLPLWTSMFLAPLTIFFEPCFTFFIEGLSGTYKSGITALALNHFGANFNYNRFPASWSFTDNKLEKLLFLLKDMPLVIDDWAPGQNTKVAKELEQKAERIIRAQANRQGRGRLTADTSSRKTYKPRGFLITSGEHLPGGYSATARMFVVELYKGDVDRLKFFSALNEKHLYSQCMTQYLLWIDRNWEVLRTELPKKVHAWTEEALAKEKDQHARLPGAVANLYAALTTALSFFIDMGILNEAETDGLLKLGWDIFMKWSYEQSLRVNQERPGKRFVEMLGILKDAGKVTFWDVDDAEPREAIASRVAVGWADKDGHYFLNPDIAYAAVVRLGNDTENAFTIKSDAVWKDLKELGYTECTEGRTKFAKKIYGSPKWVVALKKFTLDQEINVNQLPLKVEGL